MFSRIIAKFDIIKNDALNFFKSWANKIKQAYLGFMAKSYAPLVIGLIANSVLVVLGPVVYVAVLMTVLVTYALAIAFSSAEEKKGYKCPYGTAGKAA